MKGGSHVAAKLGTELVEKIAERAVKEAAKEGAERVVKETAEECAKRLAKEAAEAAIRKLDPAMVQRLTEALGEETLMRLAGGMATSTLHGLDLAATVARVGPDALCALVHQEGVDAVTHFGPEALTKVGRTALERAAAMSEVVIADAGQLQKKWKHAADFGITSPWRKTDTAAQAAYVEALNATVRGADQVFVGPYSGVTAIHHFLGDRVVLTTLDGEFISGWANAADKLAGIVGLAPPGGSRYFRAR